MMQDAPPQVVAVQDEPRHRQVFHQGSVRILDVQIAAGDVTLYHTHDTAILYVPISLSPTDTQILGQQWLGVRGTDRSRFEGLVVATDTSYAVRPLTHRVKNVGPGPFRLIAITNAANPESRTTSVPPGRPVHTSNWYHATDLLVAGGEGTEWHTAYAPLVIVQPSVSRARVELGKEVSDLSAPGAWAFVPAGSRYRILGSAGSRVVVVQVNQ